MNMETPEPISSELVEVVEPEKPATPDLGIRRHDLQQAVESHIESIKLSEDPTSRMLPTYLALKELESMVKDLRQKGADRFVEVLEHHGTQVPQWEPKKNLKKGEDKRQKVDAGGDPVFRFMPAEIEFGDMRYVAKYPSTVKPKLTGKDAIRCIFMSEKVGGDIDTFLEILPAILSSDAYRQSEIKKALGDTVWHEMYERVSSKKIDTDTPRKREIAELNTFFMKQYERQIESARAQREAEGLEAN